MRPDLKKRLSRVVATLKKHGWHSKLADYLKGAIEDWVALELLLMQFSQADIDEAVSSGWLIPVDKDGEEAFKIQRKKIIRETS